MSEYQYYEFVAVDKPLTPKQMAELRSRSTRAVITPTSFVNDYQWGNLKGDPVDWVRRYFDVHVYVANWCSCRLLLRMPNDAVDVGMLHAFETDSTFTVDRKGADRILEWALNESEDYDRFGQEDGRGWMGRLMPLRDELLRGDLRPLYLGWLAGVSVGEVDDEAIEPPPPPGLSRLTAAQQSLADFLDVDPDLITAAGQSDPREAETDDNRDVEMDAWIADIPMTEKLPVLKLLLTGQAQQAERRLKSGFLAWQRERRPSGNNDVRRRSVAELQRMAADAAETRQQQEVIQRRKAEAVRQAKRETYLRTLATDFDKHWRAAGERAERGIASAYDEVQRVIVELAEAYALCSTRIDFDRRLAQFMARHGNRSALVRRLIEAGLWKKSQR